MSNDDITVWWRTLPAADETMTAENTFRIHRICSRLTGLMYELEAEVNGEIDEQELIMLLDKCIEGWIKLKKAVGE